MRRCWVNFQCRRVLQFGLQVGQGPTALAVDAGGGCLAIFIFICPFSPLSPSLWETARYRLKYCLKGTLNPKQPTKQSKHPPTALTASAVIKIVGLPALEVYPARSHHPTTPKTQVMQGPTALAVDAGGGCLAIFIFICPFSPLSPSLWETARYRLKYCLKGTLNPKQPTKQSKHPPTALTASAVIKIVGLPALEVYPARSHHPTTPKTQVMPPCPMPALPLIPSPPMTLQHIQSILKIHV